MEAKGGINERVKHNPSFFFVDRRPVHQRCVHSLSARCLAVIRRNCYTVTTTKAQISNQP
eukprot:1946110-Amphidinium_carterae.1